MDKHIHRILFAGWIFGAILSGLSFMLGWYLVGIIFFTIHLIGFVDRIFLIKPLH